MGRQSGDRLSSYISVPDTPPAQPPTRVVRRASVREPTPPRLVRERTPLRESPPRMDRDEMAPITEAASPGEQPKHCLENGPVIVRHMALVLFVKFRPLDMSGVTIMQSGEGGERCTNDSLLYTRNDTKICTRI